MRFSLLPREIKFFDYFDELAGYLVDGAAQFVKMMSNYTDLKHSIKQIKQIEHEADVVVIKILKGVDGSFVTPWEREDLHALATALDNVMDAIESLTYRFGAYRVERPTEPAIDAAKMLHVACVKLREAVNLSRDFKKDTVEFQAALQEVDRIEHDVDDMTREAIAELFQSPTDPIQLIVWKELYERLESATDRCQDVANVLTGISIKNA